MRLECTDIRTSNSLKTSEKYCTSKLLIFKYISYFVHLILYDLLRTADYVQNNTAENVDIIIR